MKKYIVVILVFLLFTLAACSNKGASDETKTYEIGTEIRSLDIEINAADFIIEEGNEFYVESNLEDLIVSERNGVLKIVEKEKIGIHRTDAVLRLCIPNDIVFENVDITVGAGKLTTDSLSTNSAELKLGAGKVEIECLNVYYDAEIEGGAGQVSIANGTLNNLTLEMGMGELNLCVTLLGDCDLEFGVGESNLTLIGNKDDYKLDIEKGIGSISIDGKDISDFNNATSGQNMIEIDGGVGAINIDFKAE